jgi:hypothetical protein
LFLSLLFCFLPAFADSEGWAGSWSEVARFMPFAAPLRTGLAGEAEGEGAEVASPLPCETTTQLPNPAVVAKDARQRSLPVPPVH